MSIAPSSRTTCIGDDPSGKFGVSIEILSGPLDGLEFHFDQPTITIGRVDHNDLCLGLDHLVSRRHARLSLEGETLWVEDTQSLNGTYLEDRRLAEKTPISSGDIVRVGMSDLQVRVMGAAPARSERS